MECELTNMIMIKNPENNCVLVQNRVKYWKGVSFPGGHVEKGESFTESAAREVKEETGLDIKEPKLCGIVHWCHKETDKRYIVILYKTDSFSGQLVEETEEGKVFWVPVDKIYDYQMSPHFSEYLKIFLSEKNEAFGLHDDNADDLMQII